MTDTTLDEFKAECQSLYACFFFSVAGMQERGKQIKKTRPSQLNRVFIGPKDPMLHRPIATLNSRALIQSLSKDGIYSNELAKSLLVMIFARWDEFYRPLLANHRGVDKNSVKSDLMGALRLLRNVIVHANSKIDEQLVKRLAPMGWELIPGEIIISEEMMQQFIELTHSLDVRFTRYAT
ncbi:MAG: hypothetical protein ABI858_00660 [Pseudoxanthomonas sp.]